jgi:hypothetical protein
LTTPNRVGRPPKPGGNHAHIGFKTTRTLAGKFHSIYPVGSRSEPFQVFLAWLMSGANHLAVFRQFVRWFTWLTPDERQAWLEATRDLPERGSAGDAKEAA